MRTNDIRRLALLPATLLLLGACATTGATLGSGVGDAYLEDPPFYAGRDVTDDARTAALPVSYQRGAVQMASFDPAASAGTPTDELLREMNAFLDSLVVETGMARVAAPAGTPPDVRFGCESDPSGDCAERDEGSALGRGGERMHLAVGRPSREWIAGLDSALGAVGAARALSVTLETGQYLVRQTGLRGSKSVRLGTGYTVDLPWLTSLETPVSVVQLTGALVGPDGKAIRIGAEGLLARRTSFVVSALGAQALVTDEDIQRLRTLRREDLPGQPLAWQVALRQLVAELAGKRELR
jgi:hypothetical protein